MKNLKNYPDNELSLTVRNDERLYNIRNDDDFFQVISNEFVFTKKQLSVLLEHLEIHEMDLDIFKKDKELYTRGIL